MFKIFGSNVKEGQKKITKVFVGHLAHGAEISIPVLVLRGNQEGPTFWINGAVHGDELNGSIAAWELFNELNTNDIQGTIIITPIANPLAFENRDKISDIDNLDMDTTFPGDLEGLFTQRIAYKIFSEIRKHADYLLNFHTLSTPYKAVPYTVTKIVPNAKEEVVNKSREMAISFGVQTNCLVDLAKADGELPGVTNGALDITCIQNDIPAFMAEAGSGGVIENKYVSIAKKGIVNLLIYLELMSGVVDRPSEQYLITKRKFLRSDTAGIVNVNVEPGDIVPLGTKFTTTHYFDKELHVTNVENDSYIIGTRKDPVVNTGDRVAFVGTEWHEI